jgi:hypothetical protein
VVVDWAWAYFADRCEARLVTGNIDDIFTLGGRRVWVGLRVTEPQIASARFKLSFRRSKL